MVKLLIVADDFTGALDTGVQFTARGARTCVVTDPAYDFSRAKAETQVLVLDAETRHLTPEAAYSVVRRAVEGALRAGFTHIYKKTDSALRGNVGAELTAVLDGAGAESISFLPALPKMDRITRRGIHYIDGVPVAESVFGRDPFEPVGASSVAEIIAAQSEVPVERQRPAADRTAAGPGGAAALRRLRRIRRGPGGDPGPAGRASGAAGPGARSVCGLRQRKSRDAAADGGGGGPRLPPRPPESPPEAGPGLAEERGLRRRGGEMAGDRGEGKAIHSGCQRPRRL